MQRLHSVEPQQAQGHTRELLQAVKGKLGLVPNMTKAMANSPAVLEAYLNFNGALTKGVLPAKVREQLALNVGEANHCDYCVAAHSAIGKSMGLSPDAVLDSRRAHAADPKTAALLRFARTVIEKQGVIADGDVAAVRQAGFGDAEIAEVVAHVALNVFTNYFNNVAGTPLDFPQAEPLPAA